MADGEAGITIGQVEDSLVVHPSIRILVRILVHHTDTYGYIAVDTYIRTYLTHG